MADLTIMYSLLKNKLTVSLKTDTKLTVFYLHILRPLKNANFCSSSRKAIILTTGIHGVFRGLKFEPDTEIGQISADFEKWRFAKVSYHWAVSSTRQST